MFQTEVVEKVKTHILYSVTFFWKSCCVWDNVEKYCRVGQATNDMLDTWGYRHPLEYIILLFHFNNGCTNVPQCYIYVHCLSYVNNKKVFWCEKKNWFILCFSLQWTGVSIGLSTSHFHQLMCYPWLRMFFLSMIQNCWHFTMMLESKQIYMHGLCLRWHFQRYATWYSMVCLLYQWKTVNAYQVYEERIILCNLKCLRIKKIKPE